MVYLRFSSVFRISIGFLKEFFFIVFIMFGHNLQKLSLFSADLQNSELEYDFIASVKSFANVSLALCEITFQWKQ